MQLEMKLDIFNSSRVSDIENKVVSEAARMIVCEIFGRRFEHKSPFREMLETEVKKIVINEIDTDFKEEVKNKVTSELSDKFMRTKQFNDIKKEYGIEPDSAIKSGLKQIIAELVREEINKKLKM